MKSLAAQTIRVSDFFVQGFGGRQFPNSPEGFPGGISIFRRVRDDVEIGFFRRLEVSRLFEQDAFSVAQFRFPRVVSVTFQKNVYRVRFRLGFDIGAFERQVQSNTVGKFLPVGGVRKSAVAFVDCPFRFFELPFFEFRTGDSGENALVDGRVPTDELSVCGKRLGEISLVVGCRGAGEIPFETFGKRIAILLTAMEADDLVLKIETGDLLFPGRTFFRMECRADEKRKKENSFKHLYPADS